MRIMQKIANLESGGGIVGAIKRNPKKSILAGATLAGGALLGGNALIDNIGDATGIDAIKDNSGLILGGATGVGAYKGIKHLNKKIKEEEEDLDPTNPNNWR